MEQVHKTSNLTLRHQDRFVLMLFVRTSQQYMCQCVICKYKTTSTDKKKEKTVFYKMYMQTQRLKIHV